MPRPNTKPRHELTPKVRAYLDAGQCTGCGVHPPAPGYRTCQHCRDLQRTRDQRLLAEGICVTCGKMPAWNGQQKCKPCRDRSNLRRKLNKLEKDAAKKAPNNQPQLVTTPRPAKTQISFIKRLKAAINLIRGK